jgi:hypothetical protein
MSNIVVVGRTEMNVGLEIVPWTVADRNSTGHFIVAV